ncbi:hypothetical protein [Phyllobacterium leguminum]|uniref:Lipoprotein n=1 Tax=Phyllobacterium leguminum TaxID=314237 RepID=A0A318T423_9HYPH|nr:hypothetical protein [Phyllobacterium leguminum]PYE89552.1 hypothetical protein C7477_10359 [Phyllobacterium leguminum]
MSQRIRLSGRFILISLSLAGLTACAGGPEFQGAPQAGAANTGAWPTFGHMPKGATTQFTAQDTQNLKSELEADQRRQQAIPAPRATTGAQVNNVRKQVQEDAAKTLEEIEKTGSN